MNSVYASGASAIAVPGWPEFACWTASIARARIVSIDRLAMSPCSALRPEEELAWLGALQSTDRG
jgi:hypothetical protein